MNIDMGSRGLKEASPKKMIFPQLLPEYWVEKKTI